MPVPVDLVFGALADPTRRRVVESLAERPSVTATGLAAELPITRQAVSKHLGTLLRAQLVSSKRVGRETRYTLRPQALGEAGEWIARVGGEWDGRLDRLARLLEGRD